MKEMLRKRTTKSKSTFVSGSIFRSMLLFAGPYMLGILVQNLYGAVDLFVVGHFATTADVSAVTIGSQLMSMVTQLIIGFSTGITILIGRYYGAKEPDGLSRTTGTSILLFGSAGIILTILVLLLHNPLVTVMQTPAEAVEATQQYLWVCGLGVIFITGYNVVSNILIGLGNSKTPFLFIVIACIINIVLDVVLVNYVHLGAMGAAIATTIAQAGSFLFSLLYLRIKGLGFPLSKKHIRVDKEIVGQIGRIGGPVAIQNVMIGASFLFITAIINQMGLIASAAVGVVEKLITFLFVPAQAMGTAVSTATAQNIGAKQYPRARKSMWYGVMIALIPSILITVFCQFGGEWLTSILSGDAQVIRLAAEYLRSYIFDIIMVSFVFSMNGYFNGCGKSWFSLIHSLLTTFLVRVPVALLLSRLANTSLFLIGWAAPLSTLVSLFFCIWYLWKLRKQIDG